MLGGYKEYISKDTGLTVRNANVKLTTEEGTFDVITDYKYEFGVVTDDDIKEPNILEYEIVEEN